jgi:hypothetical protein
MQLSFLVLLLVILTICSIVIYILLLRKKNVPVELFARALKNENNGEYAAAIVTYENALDEVNKIKFNSKLKDKIIEKLKILHTIKDYEDHNRAAR